MKTRHLTLVLSRLALALSVTLFGTIVWAADPTATEHAAHHPASASSAVEAMPAVAGASTSANTIGANSFGKVKMDQMAGHMKTMQALHQKFMAAKTAEERQAMMPEHMQAMKDAMGMMQGTSCKGMMGNMKSMLKPDNMPADMAAHHQMMEKRMEMMQSMMQMMMDRLPGGTGK